LLYASFLLFVHYLWPLASYFYLDLDIRDPISVAWASMHPQFSPEFFTLTNFSNHFALICSFLSGSPDHPYSQSHPLILSWVIQSHIASVWAPWSHEPISGPRSRNSSRVLHSCCTYGHLFVTNLSLCPTYLLIYSISDFHT
jgi:hypothetical protein